LLHDNTEALLCCEASPFYDIVSCAVCRRRAYGSWRDFP
jgi:hypothetical protein